MLDFNNSILFIYQMKLERVLRKAAPFLLIAILFACLFIQPQKEGMKAFTEVDQLSHNTNQYTEHISQQPKVYSHNIFQRLGNDGLAIKKGYYRSIEPAIENGTTYRDPDFEKYDNGIEINPETQSFNKDDMSWLHGLDSDDED